MSSGGTMPKQANDCYVYGDRIIYRNRSAVKILEDGTVIVGYIDGDNCVSIEIFCHGDEPDFLQWWGEK
jgi:hypothetical protein